MDGEKINVAFDTLQPHHQDDGNTVWSENSDDSGVGAPHIRDRNYWVAHADSKRSTGQRVLLRPEESGREPRHILETTGCGAIGGLADTDSGQQHGIAVVQGFERNWQNTGRAQGSGQLEPCCDNGWAGPVNGFWRDADWLGCTDGKWRPVEPGTFPLVTGASARVVRLRGYGNAINAEAARAWIETVMECLP